MTYELLNLRQIFEAALILQAREREKLGELLSETEPETLRVLNAIQNNMAHLEPASARAYLLQHQKALCIFLDDVDRETEKLALSSTEADDRDKRGFLEQLLVGAEKLLCDLQQYFPSHFDHTDQVPLSILRKARPQLHRHVEHLSRILSGAVTEDLHGHFTDLFSGLLEEGKKITFDRLEYLNSFFDQLREELSALADSMETIDIILAMVSLNFNHPLFYHFCCGYFGGELEKSEDISGQYRILNFLKKILAQAFASSRGHYDDSFPPIAGSLTRYLEAELDFLKSVDLVAQDLSNHGMIENSYKVSFSVRQLAIFIHLQVEAGIIVSQSPKMLHQYITDHYSTCEQDKISAKSFKNAYYGNAGDDVEKVLDKIVTMLALAQ